MKKTNRGCKKWLAMTQSMKKKNKNSMESNTECLKKTNKRRKNI